MQMSRIAVNLIMAHFIANLYGVSNYRETRIYVLMHYSQMCFRLVRLFFLCNILYYFNNIGIFLIYRLSDCYGANTRIGYTLEYRPTHTPLRNNRGQSEPPPV